MHKLVQWLSAELSFPIDAENLALRADQLRARMHLMPMMVGGQLVLEPLFVLLFWEQASHKGLLLWWAGMVALHLIEGVWWLRHRTRLDTVQDCRKWHIRFSVATLSVGLMWGFSAIWFFPANLSYQALLICVIFGLSAAAVTTNQNHPPSFYIDILSIMLPLIFRVSLEQDAIHLVLSVILVLFLMVVLNAGRELSRAFWQSLRHRYESDALVEQLRKQKALAEQARQQAEAANSEKSRFLAAASHDLRQPLQALELFSEALTGRAQEENVRHLAEQIGKSVHALSDMFNELLDLSRLEAGMLQPRWQNFALPPLLDRLYVNFAPLAQAKGLGFEIPAAGDAVIYSDPLLLERILRNLLANAIRYTDSGKVVLRCIPSEKTLRFEVADTGIGISAEVLPHIFEEYYQADNQHRDRRKGLGLGLAIVRRIENLLDCRIEVNSEPGKGTVFGLHVPFGDGAELTQPFVITHSGHDLSGTVVALVEDDPDIRMIAAELMREWGCRVFAGELPGEVMRDMDIQTARPDLLVCDYRLPQGMTALHAIAQMRELWGAEVPAMVLTGETAPEVLRDIHASGTMLLHKPITPARLRSLMHLAMRGNSAARG